MRIVVKVGTSTLAHASGCINIRRVEGLCRVLADLKNEGHEILLVSSGAIGMGMGRLRLAEKPADMPTKQACAAVGQCELMYVYDKLFTGYSHVTAQVLLTGADIEHDERRVNVQNTLNRLLSMGTLPVVNENDTVSTEEISMGDNDTLSAIVACLCGADLLVILSDIDGLYDCDPHKNPDARLLREVRGVTDDILNMAGGAGSSLGTGGMATKLRAAAIAGGSGIDMVIMNGSRPEKLYDLLEGEPVGTRFLHTEEACL
ncbi:MAG: glutamate 5-kinase [Oscillospiraceae bacterium]|nr:glutamate 5-kinase [Oscillospiraceae bacterium]